MEDTQCEPLPSTHMPTQPSSTSLHRESTGGVRIGFGVEHGGEGIQIVSQILFWFLAESCPEWPGILCVAKAT